MKKPATMSRGYAHPLLDPFLPSHHPSETRRWLLAYRDVAQDPGKAGWLMRTFGAPVVAGDQAPHQNVQSYLKDADQYLDDLLCSESPADRQRLRLLPETRCLLDIGELLRTNV